MPASFLTHLRKICLSLPDAYELETWEIPTFRIGKKIFCFNSEVGGRPSIWVKVTPETRSILMDAGGPRFFRPPYLGHKGWIGMYLDKNPDWDEVRDLVARSFYLIAPKKYKSLPSKSASQVASRAANPRGRGRAERAGRRGPKIKGKAA